MRLLFLLVIIGLPFLEGAPRRYDDDLSIQIREIRDTLDYLRREVAHHEEELRTFEQKTLTQDDILDTIRKETKESHLSQKQHLKNHQENIQEQLDSKLSVLDTTHKAISSDLKQFKGHSSETQEVLKTYREKITTLEKNVEALSRNMDSLQVAVNHLVEYIKAGTSVGVSSASEISSKFYKVKAGDTLEKIARAAGSTVKMIKELNSLTKDQIVIGQTLKLPE